MNWDTRRNPIEHIVEWTAPAVLAAAVGWSAWTVLASFTVAAISMAIVMGLGVGLLRRLGAPGSVQAEFEPVAFEDGFDEELLLDDPLFPATENSRVVRLFDKQPSTPGEMIARISDFLEVMPNAPQLAAAIGGAEPHHPSDASQALHEALANIRASLR